jgi:hypothetical protein
LQAVLAAWLAGSDLILQARAQALWTRLPLLNQAEVPKACEISEQLSMAVLDIRSDLGRIRRCVVLAETDEAAMHPEAEVIPEEELVADAERSKAAAHLQLLVGVLRQHLRAVTNAGNPRR